MRKSKLYVVAVAAAAAALVVIAGVWVMGGRKLRGPGSLTAASDDVANDSKTPRFHTDPGGPQDQDPNRPPQFVAAGPREPLTEEQKSTVMADWRQAIVSKNAEQVEAAFTVFQSRPAEMREPLMTCAATDQSPRVRAFCTRSLGYLKLLDADATLLLRKLLDDDGEFVRSNAAWALALAGDRDSRGKLQSLAKKDPSAKVRKSAAEAAAALR